MSSAMNVPVVLQRAWVLEDLATLIATVPAHGIGSNVEGLRDAITQIFVIFIIVHVIVSAISMTVAKIHVAE